MLIRLMKHLVATAPLVHPDPGLREAVWRVKYCLRGLAQARLTSAWFSVLQTPQLSGLSRADPHIRSKLQRAYLHRALSANRRLAALKAHYGFVARHLSEQMRREIFEPGGFHLASLPLGGAGTLDLRLVYRHCCTKEGDLSILLQERHTAARIYCLTFSIAADRESCRQFFIGGLQGFSEVHANGRVVQMTRAMHGLRPKALVLFTFQQLATAWGCSEIRAVSNNMHIYRHYQRRRDFAAQYDAFWEESGGRLAADGFFDLPVMPTPRPWSEIKANKRLMYRRRLVLLEEVGRQIRDRAQAHYIKAAARPNFAEADSVTRAELSPTYSSVGT